MFLVYNPDLDRVYRIPVAECGGSNMGLCLQEGRAGDRRFKHFAKDYELTSGGGAGQAQGLITPGAHGSTPAPAT